MKQPRSGRACVVLIGGDVTSAVRVYKQTVMSAEEGLTIHEWKLKGLYNLVLFVYVFME